MEVRGCRALNWTVVRYVAEEGLGACYGVRGRCNGGGMWRGSDDSGTKSDPKSLIWTIRWTRVLLPE